MTLFIQIIKSNKFFLFILCLFLSTYFLNILDKNHDGIIKNLVISHLCIYVRCFLGILMIIMLGAKSKISFIKNTTFSIFVLIFFYLFLEFACWGLSVSNALNFKTPSNSLLLVDANFEKMDRKPFWGDFNKDFGKWRNPNDSLQKFRCDDNTSLVYQTNNVGARDVERSLKNNSSKKRVIFLGDSFVEGIMVNMPDRCSNILEKKTGNEHLNFGINGTSPIDYYLVYKTLAKKFDHDVVIVGVLPANDFEDYSEGDEITLVNFPIYRPYWKSTNSNYQLKYSLASINQSYGSLAIYDKPDKIFQTKDSVYQRLPFVEKIKSEFIANSYILGLIGEITKKKILAQYQATSMFQTYPKSKWNTFSYSLKKIFEEAKGKQVIVVSIPTLKDVKLFQKNHQNALSTQLSLFCKTHKVNYIDLLLSFGTHPNPEQLYVNCDGHWNEKGEKMAAEILQKNATYNKIITF
jgi:hypothetical protein